MQTMTLNQPVNQLVIQVMSTEEEVEKDALGTGDEVVEDIMEDTMEEHIME